MPYFSKEKVMLSVRTRTGDFSEKKIALSVRTRTDDFFPKRKGYVVC